MIGHGQGGWSEPERAVMSLTDELYEELLAEGRRPARGAVRLAARELGDRIEVVYRHEADGRSGGGPLARRPTSSVGSIGDAGAHACGGVGEVGRDARMRRALTMADCFFARGRQ